MFVDLLQRRITKITRNIEACWKAINVHGRNDLFENIFDSAMRKTETIM